MCVGVTNTVRFIMKIINFSILLVKRLNFLRCRKTRRSLHSILSVIYIRVTTLVTRNNLISNDLSAVI